MAPISALRRVVVYLVALLPLVRAQHEDYVLMPRRVCADLPLEKDQMLCLARNGVLQALIACQSQFAQDRWNCPTESLMPMIQSSTNMREASFMKAITSAMVAYEVAKACYGGYILKSCQCAFGFLSESDSVSGKTDAECERMLKLATSISKSFLDTSKSQLLFQPWHKQKLRRGKHRQLELMKHHNNYIGRQVFTKNAETVCQCHGLSGSCSLQTCFKTSPRANTVSAELRIMYDNAQHILPSRAEGLHQLRPKPKGLLFTEASPSYCKRRRPLGFEGVGGRECNADDDDTTGMDPSLIPGKCSSLCCNRGSNSRVEHKVPDGKPQCNWTCCWKTHCHQDYKTKTLHFCN